MSEFAPPLDAVRRLAAAQSPDDPFAAAVHGARLPMLVTGGRESDFPIVFVNAAFTALTGYSAEEVRGRNPRFLQGPDTDPAAVAVLRSALAGGHETSIELLNRRKDGSTFWNGMFLSPVRDAGGDIHFWFGSQLDVTQRKEAEQALLRSHGDLEAAVRQRTEHLRRTAEQKTLLLHEVEHRVKNNLQLISSLIQFQARRTQDPAVRAALREVQERVSAVSTVHRRLFHSEDAGRFDVGRFLKDLVDDLIGRSRRDDIELRFEVEAVEAGAARAAPLALLVNEILTRALNGAGAPDRAGRLHVGLRSADGRFTIELGDDGPDSTEQRRRDLGGPTGIVEILQRQLGAEIEWRDNRPGVAALITLPLEHASP